MELSTLASSFIPKLARPGDEEALVRKSMRVREDDQALYRWMGIYDRGKEVLQILFQSPNLTTSKLMEWMLGIFGFLCCLEMGKSWNCYTLNFTPHWEYEISSLYAEEKRNWERSLLNYGYVMFFLLFEWSSCNGKKKLFL